MAIERYGHTRAISKVVEDLIMGRDKKVNTVKKLLEFIEKLEREGKLAKIEDLTPEKIDEIVESEIEEEMAKIGR